MKFSALGLVTTLIAATVVGALVAIGLYTTFVPFPQDVMARAAAFQPENRDWFFQNASEVFPTRTVARDETAQPLEVVAGTLDGFTFTHKGVTKTLADFHTDMETSGLLILHKGKVVHERYDRGANAGTQFTTFSLVKSFTSTLVGFAVQDGLIKSVDDPLTDYLPETAGTAYDGVTIKQALQMSSGVQFDKEPGNDTIDFITQSAVMGKKRAYDIAISYPRAAEPGTVFQYNTAESQVLLELVRRVTGKTASAYMEEKMWRPLGMEHDAGWILDAPGQDGHEIGGAFFNAALRDWARLGLLMEQDGVWNGKALLPADWVARATLTTEDRLKPGVFAMDPNRGYGWHWWTYPDGTFIAGGANGQGVYVDQANDIVVARASAWPEGFILAHAEQYMSLFKALKGWAQAQAGGDAVATTPPVDGTDTAATTDSAGE